MDNNYSNMMVQQGGPMISGKWLNKTTGTVVNVRDSIIDGDNMIIITDKGQIPMYEFSNDYIQASENIYDERGNIIGKEDVDLKDFQVITPKMIQDVEKAKQDFNDEFINLDEFVNNDNVDNESITNITVDKPNQIKECDIIERVEVKQVSKNYDIIDKVFNKIKSTPEISIDLKWEDFPKEQINTLINYLDVNINEIGEYIINKYINYDNINNIILSKLDEKISN